MRSCLAMITTDNPDSDSSRGVDLRPRELEKELAEEYKEDK